MTFNYKIPYYDNARRTGTNEMQIRNKQANNSSIITDIDVYDGGLFKTQNENSPLSLYINSQETDMNNFYQNSLGDYVSYLPDYFKKNNTGCLNHDQREYKILT